MPLGDGFRHAERLGMALAAEPPDRSWAETASIRFVEPVAKWRAKGPRRVRTPEGMKVFGQPIGTIITADMVARARASGKLKGGGEQRYGHYGPPRPGVAGRMPGGPRHGGVLPGAHATPGLLNRPPKAAAPKLQFEDHGSGPKSKFLQRIPGSSFNDVKAMLAEVHNSDLNDKDFNEVVDALLARGAKLRPNRAPLERPKKGGKAKEKVHFEPQKPKGQPPPAHKPGLLNKPPPGVGPNAPKKSPTAQPSPTDRGREAGKVQHDFMTRIGQAKTQEDLNNLSREQAREQRLTVREKVPVINAIMARRKAIARTVPPPPQQPQGPSADRRFMDASDEISRVEQAIANGDKGADKHIARLLDAVRSDPVMDDGMKRNLSARLNLANKGGKQRGSPRYDTFADDVNMAMTLHEVTVADRAIARDTKLKQGEKDRLQVHIYNRLKDLGINPDLIDAPSEGLDPKEWDSHPDHLKDTGSPLSPQRQRAALTGRQELADRAEQLRQLDRLAAPDKTPAGREIAAGTPLDKVKNPDGMMEYVNAHPERFTKSMSQGGQGGAFTVYDKQQDRDFFFKETNAGTRKGSHGANVEMFGEAMNEVTAGKLGQAFPSIFPDADFAGPIENGKNPTIRMDHLHEVASKMPGFKKVDFDAKRRWEENVAQERVLRKNAAPVRDPKNPLTMHIFDFLANQTDRHDENYGVVTHKDGTVSFVALDNGAAFHGFDSFAHKHEPLPDHFINEPHNIGYAEWAHVYTSADEWYAAMARGNFMARETVAGYKHHNRDNVDEIEKDAQEILTGFAAMNTDQIRADLLRRFPNMADYEKAHLDSSIHIFKSRLKNISAKDVARFITEFQQKDEGFGP